MPSLGRQCPPTPTVGTSSAPVGTTDPFHDASSREARRSLTRSRSVKKSTSMRSQYRPISAEKAIRTSRYAFSSVFTNSAVRLLVTNSRPRVTMRRYREAMSTGVAGSRPATILSDSATRCTRCPGMTRFGLLPSRTSRPSMSPWLAKNGRMMLCIVDGASVDSMITSGRVAFGRLERGGHATHASMRDRSPGRGRSCRSVRTPVQHRRR